jgi:ribosomal protein L37AE/L43A
MNPYLGTIIYNLLHRRITCRHCGALDHHRPIGRNIYLCNSCLREFTRYESK